MPTPIHQLDRLIAALPVVSEQKRYWLIRTQGGTYYDSFRKNDFIAIGYNKIPVGIIETIKKRYQNDTDGFTKAVRKLFADAYKNDENIQPGVVSGQVLRFMYEMKAGDLVMIPSVSSLSVTFGKVVADEVYIPSFDEIEKTGCTYQIRRKMSWHRVVERSNFDPYLYKVFLSHQAVNNVDGYAEVIERTVNNFFIRRDEAHLILDVRRTTNIHAKDLFGFGNSVLQLLDDMGIALDLDVSSSYVNLKVSLNSPGKLHFFGKNMKTVVILGILVLLINGGGLKVGEHFDLSTPGLIKTITEALNAHQDRVLQERIVNKYLDSLKVQNPDDLIKLMQQTSTNKKQP